MFGRFSTKIGATTAATMPDQMDEEVKRKRNRQLRELSDRRWEAFAAGMEGETLSAVVLNGKGQQRGSKGPVALTDNYLRVACESPRSLASGDRVQVEVLGASRGSAVRGRVL